MRELFPLGTNEQVVMRLRKHWFIFAEHVVVYVFFLAIPFVIWALQRRFLPELFLDPTSFGNIAMALLFSAYLLFVLQQFFTSWVEYALDVWIVTNMRVMNIDQRSLFHRTVSELALYNIQDVTSETKGPFATFLGYGTIVVETAGEQEHFVFPNLPRPEVIAKQMMELSRASSQTQKPAQPVMPPSAKKV